MLSTPPSHGQGPLNPTDSGPDLLAHYPSTPEQMHEWTPELASHKDPTKAGPVTACLGLPRWDSASAPTCCHWIRYSDTAVTGHGTPGRSWECQECCHPPPTEMVVTVGTAGAQPWQPTPHNPNWERSRAWLTWETPRPTHAISQSSPSSLEQRAASFPAKCCLQEPLNEQPGSGTDQHSPFWQNLGTNEEASPSLLSRCHEPELSRHWRTGTRT